MAKNAATLHEAMVVCMVRKKRFVMSTSELALLISEWDLWRRPEDDKFPEPWQVFLRANEADYQWLFKVAGNKDDAMVSLRIDGAGNASN